MPTPAERRALSACAAILAGGLLLRAWQHRETPAVPSDAARLDAQIAAVDSASDAEPRATRTRRGGSRRRDARPPGQPRETAAPQPPRDRGAITPRDSIIDVDAASLRELQLLPGVGPTLAERITAYRDSCGAFGTLERLDNVPGIGPALLRKLAPHVRFGASGDDRCTPPPTRSRTRRRRTGTSDFSRGGASPECGFGDATRGLCAACRPHRMIVPAACRPGCAHVVLTIAHPPSSPPPHDRMAATVSAVPERITEQLIREGLVTRDSVDKAKREAKANGLPVNYNLIKLGLIDEVELTKVVARSSRMPAVDLTRFEVDPRIARLISAELAVKHQVLPLKRDGRTLTVAIADPSNMGILEDLKFITRYDIFPVLAGEVTLRTAIEKNYDSGDSGMSTLLADIAGMDGDVEVVEEHEEDVSAAALAAQVDDAPVVKLINAILTDAVKRGASDIHFECFEHELRVRYRIDGALQEVMKPPPKLKAALISRFKIMAQLNIAERRVPQDGRIKLKMGNKVIDYRVSTLPTLFGEKVVLRILDKGNLTLDLEKFGIEPRAERELMEAVSNPYGMVLVTGPTGSGKTTTLYSALSKINNIDVNIMTSEDPVEYNLFGINQVQVRSDIGMTFAAALKAFLRQDPNIIMVGEIRDLETGGIAIKAALTGHLVLSTLHTNSAPETVTRLLDMGLEPFNVASALNLVLAQRLVRRICPQCKTKYTPDDIELGGAKVSRGTTLRELRFTDEAVASARAKATAEAAPFLQDVSLDTCVGDLPFFKGKGCDACNGSGLKGRQGLYEVMLMGPDLRKLILMNVGAQEIKDAAISYGMLTLRMDGWLKVMKGITTLEQVIRETSVDSQARADV